MKRGKKFDIFALIMGLIGGLTMVLVGAKYITTYLPDKDIVVTWLYLFHLFLGCIVILKGVDWITDFLDDFKKGG